MSTSLAWKRAWKRLAPGLPDKGLVALEAALVGDCTDICIGRLVLPDPSLGYGYAYPIAACALGYVVWHGFGCQTSDEVCRAFAALRPFVEAVRFTNWFDSSPWETVVRPGLLREVAIELQRRGLTRRGNHG